VLRFQDPRVGCVSGELGLEREGGVSGEGLYWKYECWIKRNESRLGFLIGCNGGIFALRAGLFEPLPPNTLVEDFVLTMRILEKGSRVVFEPGARALEPACASARDEMKRKVRIGAGGFQALGLTRRLLLPSYGLAAFAYWGHKVLRWLVPFFFLAALVSNLFLLPHPFYWATLAAQGAGAFIAGWAYYARPGGEPPRWLRPISYFYLMNFALLCGFLRFILGTQRVTWERASR
jgi:cellulose synthase/poly-beta-1,6-N-acetylglucosamine synthase-like glycosyltransferase